MNTADTPTSFSHLDSQGTAKMVGVAHKPEMLRRAVARGRIVMAEETIRQLRAQALPKGDVLTVAQIAGIHAAKRTDELIPLCHPLPLHQVTVTFEVQDNGVVITSTVETIARTGVEMEALTAVSVAALTLYDMAKAVDKGMVISEIALIEKTKTPLPQSTPSAETWSPPPPPATPPTTPPPGAPQGWSPPPVPPSEATSAEAPNPMRSPALR